MRGARPTAQAVVLLALTCMSACRRAGAVDTTAAERSTGATARNEITAGPRLELEAKTAALVAAPAREVRRLAVREIAAPGDVRPSALAWGNSVGLLALENDSGQVLRLTPSDGPAVERLRLGKRLTAPTVIRGFARELLITDNDGLTHFRDDGSILHRVPLFHAVRDLVPLSNGVVAFNPLAVLKPQPAVILINNAGARLAFWFPGPNGGPAPSRVISLSTEAHLAACAGRLIVGFVHEPRVTILTASLAEITTVNLPFPGAAALAALGRDASLTRPSDSVYWLPSFLGGVACDGDAIFVLLDLPVLRICELDLAGHVKAVYGDPTRAYRRMVSLVSGTDGRLYALALGRDRRERVFELIRRPSSD